MTKNNLQAANKSGASYQQAMALYQHGHLQAAGAMCELLLQGDRQNVPVLELSAGIALELGNEKLAADYLLKQLKLQPNNAHAHCNLGMVLYVLGKNEEAYKHCRKALALQPDLADAYDHIGNIHESRNEVQEALESYEKALELGSQDPRVFVNAGNMSQLLGDLQMAENYFRKALKQDSSYVPAHNFLGAVLLKSECYDEAEKAFQSVLKQQINNPEALNNLGAIWMERGDLEKAQNYFERALHVDANYVGAYINLGHLYEERNDKSQSLRHYKKALYLEPTNLHIKALIDADKEDYQSAEAAWRSVIESRPKEQDGYLGLASLYAKQGCYEDARAILKQAENITGSSIKLYSQWSKMEEGVHNLDAAECLIKKVRELSPDNANHLLLQAKLLHRRKKFEEALELLQQIKPASIDSKKFQTEYLFELGRVQDKLGQYREAFEAYNAANQTKYEYLGVTYDPTEDEKRLQEYKQFYTNENWKQLKKIALDSDTITPAPIFIVGFPRSGTSLLEQMLGSHQLITAAGELPYIITLVNEKCSEITTSKRSYPNCLMDPSTPLNHNRLALLREFYHANIKEFCAADEVVTWVTDKMPHNILHLGLINLLFPKSPIIHITRHPLDACLSAFFADFGRGHRYTSSLVGTATHYKKVMELFAHYKQTLGLPLMEIRYEELVEHQGEVLHKLLNYIGLPWDDRCLQHHENKRVVKTASYEQVTQKVYNTSRYRYRNYRDVITPIIPILEPTIECLGYSVD